MTKTEFIEAIDRANPLGRIADDTGRTPRERDLARILQLATLLLQKGESEKSIDILRIYLSELK